MSEHTRTEAAHRSLRSKTLSGLRWSFSSSALSTLIQFAHVVVMGRLLSPEDFGLIALANAFLRFGSYFAEMGVGQALIQRLTLSEREIRAAFTSSVLLGLVLAGVFVTAAPLAETLAHTPEVVPVIQALALSMIIAALGNTARSLLNRELRFRGLAVIEVGSYVVGYVCVGVTLAALGFGAWSLVLAALSQALLQTLAAYSMTRHPVRPFLGRSEIMTLYGFGARVSGTQFMNVIRHALITAAVGRIAGVGALGLFDRAKLLVQLPVEKAETAATKVLFPAMSRVQRDAPTLKRLHLLQVGIVSALFLPALAGIAINADIIIAVLLGPQWTDAGPFVAWLAAAVGMIVLGHFARVISTVLALLNQRLVIEVAHVALLGSGLIALAPRYGVDGVLITLVAAEAFNYIAHTQLIRKHLAVDWRAYRAAVLPGAFATFVVSAILIVSRELLSFVGASIFASFLAQVSVGSVSLLVLWRSRFLSKLRHDLVRTTLGKDRASELADHRVWRLFLG